MNLFFLKVFSFFVGLFITLFFINYFNIINKQQENFEINKLTKETLNTTYLNSTYNKIIEDLPYKNFKYMSISTYFNIKQLGNSEGRWYDINLNSDKYDIKLNVNEYFTFSKMINLKNNKINNEGAKGADINGIELLGPKSFYYANNINSNELTEFSVIISCKINDIIQNNNILFEMTGNTEEIINDDKNINYTYSMININIQPNINNNYNFILTIGNNVYAGNINNIDKTIIKGSDLLVIGLLYTESEITLIINKEMFKYKNNNKFTIKLGSNPVIINKNGNINMDLYNFTYYKSIIPISEYLIFFKHNYYYLSGINNILKSSSSAIEEANKNADSINNKCIENSKENDSIKINKRIDELEKNLTKCFNNTTNDNTKVEEIKPFNINVIKDLKETSSNFFSFLFE